MAGEGESASRRCTVPYGSPSPVRVEPPSKKKRRGDGLVAVRFQWLCPPPSQRVKPQRGTKDFMTPTRLTVELPKRWHTVRLKPSALVARPLFPPADYLRLTSWWDLHRLSFSSGSLLVFFSLLTFLIALS